MKSYSLDHPITWVASKTFFEFNQRRLLALAAIQQRMAAIRPSNYGLTTTLIMHLIRSVCHAPDVRLPHLKRAFTDLSFELNSERFGIFFLHSLDLDACFIADIESIDDAVCSAYYESHVKVVRRRPTEFRVAPRWADLMEFPLGRIPSWEDWALGMSQNPEQLVKTWTYDRAWANGFDEVTVSLFIRFTREYVGSLRPEVLMAGIPALETLEQAMDVWTVIGIKKVVINPTFVPSSSNVPGRKPGAVSKSFPDQLGTFFPKPSSNLNKKVVYAPFIKFGYLRNYHRAWRDDRELARILEKALTKIFLELQCLPVTVPGKQLWKVKAGDILFQVNSSYFRLDSVGPNSKTDKAQQAPRAKATNNAIEETILQLYPEHNSREATAVSRKQKPITKGRSGPSKNSRIPPIRKKVVEAEHTNLTNKEIPQPSTRITLARVPNSKRMHRPVQEKLPLVLRDAATGTATTSKGHLYHDLTESWSLNFQVDDQGASLGTPQTPSSITSTQFTVGAPLTGGSVPHIDLSSGKCTSMGLHHALTKQLPLQANKAMPGNTMMLKIHNNIGAMIKIGKNGWQTPTRAGRDRNISSSKFRIHTQFLN